MSVNQSEAVITDRPTIDHDVSLVSEPPSLQSDVTGGDRSEIDRDVVEVWATAIPILEACGQVPLFFYLCQSPGVADHPRSLRSTAIIVGVV